MRQLFPSSGYRCSTDLEAHVRAGVESRKRKAVQETDTGTGQTLADLYQTNYRPLVRVAYAMCGDLDLAEDMAQEAFVRASRRLPKLRDPGAAGAYLRTTVINLVRRSFRRRLLDLRTRFRSIEVPSESGHEDRLAVRQAMAILPPGQRACVVLRYFEGLTEQETAEMLGVTVGTVKSQTHKALRRLERALEETR
jgi:RNA polymerase sigma-70 factor (sigma-E family)